MDKRVRYLLLLACMSLLPFISASSEIEDNNEDPFAGEEDFYDEIEDIGLCLGIPCGDEAAHHQDIRCRDHDTHKDACNAISGCHWMPLPRCGDGPCLDLYTNDEETTELVIGLSIGATLLVFLCLMGWVIVGCSCCARSRARYRQKVAERKELEDVHQAEMERQRAQQQQAALLEEDHIEDVDEEDQYEVDSAGTPDLLKDTEAGQDDGTAGTEEETFTGFQPRVVAVHMF
mmetsp:Transcript_40569/g.84449  ORF Transcript_40569/g.84449 Transcript_40569/m.84449 type:complete len:232 (-) Transcript_40569:994-1689(-)|eukprot:CAMPEP_0172446838 /NCGR_PEP_ID=MMETSP1065-20121228/6321_1 /TAXON_ID=265537 /ORGANISM="Amphiprora paludosa, Strain CCMP125" /LENGTH=231 /DNA_ID=CAMNT_0013198027 /DNA_START=150 /DNA_END=845 /DNA_ORIENTATION=-